MTPSHPHLVTSSIDSPVPYQAQGRGSSKTPVCQLSVGLPSSSHQSPDREPRMQRDSPITNSLGSHFAWTCSRSRASVTPLDNLLLPSVTLWVCMALLLHFYLWKLSIDRRDACLHQFDLLIERHMGTVKEAVNVTMTAIPCHQNTLHSSIHLQMPSEIYPRSSKTIKIIKSI